MLLHHLYQRCPGRGLPPTCLRTFAVALFFFFFQAEDGIRDVDRKSTRLNSSHGYISYAVFCLKKKKKKQIKWRRLERARKRRSRNKEGAEQAHPMKKARLDSCSQTAIRCAVHVAS